MLANPLAYDLNPQQALETSEEGAICHHGLPSIHPSTQWVKLMDEGINNLMPLLS
jgi:hypothetical protein